MAFSMSRDWLSILRELQENSTFSPFSKAEIGQLKTRADRYYPATSYKQVTWVYRDKPARFFDEADRNGGIMKAYMKDNSGDRRSPINGKIDGLFFACNMEWNGEPPSTSYFGNRRIKAPAYFFMSPRTRRFMFGRMRLYFSDFHCMAGNIHWATLILTFANSQWDRFCESRLPELDLNDNTFLFVKADGTVWMRQSDLRLEILYTDDIDLRHWEANGSIIESVTPVGRGSSTPGGKPKNRLCSKCNI